MDPLQGAAQRGGLCSQEGLPQEKLKLPNVGA